MLDEILNTLTDLTTEPDVPMEGVWYGACQAEQLDRWNYFVFNRLRIKTSSNKRDQQTLYQIHVIHENYIPEGYVEKVISVLESMKGPNVLRRTEDNIEYNYVFKNKTKMIVEMATITMYHPEKRGM